MVVSGVQFSSPPCHEGAFDLLTFRLYDFMTFDSLLTADS
jgi:hypothetical protein